MKYDGEFYGFITPTHAHVHSGGGSRIFAGGGGGRIFVYRFKVARIDYANSLKPE